MSCPPSASRQLRALSSGAARAVHRLVKHVKCATWSCLRSGATAYALVVVVLSIKAMMAEKEEAEADLLAVICVSSGRDNVQRRRACRNTWFRYVTDPGSPLPLAVRARLRLRFLVSSSPAAAAGAAAPASGAAAPAAPGPSSADVEEEAAQHGDVMLLDAREGYEHLWRKASPARLRPSAAARRPRHHAHRPAAEPGRRVRPQSPATEPGRRARPQASTRTQPSTSIKTPIKPNTPPGAGRAAGAGPGVCGARPRSRLLCSRR